MNLAMTCTGLGVARKFMKSDQQRIGSERLRNFICFERQDIAAFKRGPPQNRIARLFPCVRTQLQTQGSNSLSCFITQR